MGFSSIDDLVSEITVNGKFYRSIFAKISTNAATSAASRWHSTFAWTGNPGPGAYSGTAGAATPLSSTSAGALLLDAAVTPDTRHLLNMTMYTPTTTMCPATAILCDFLMYYPTLSVAATAGSALANTATLPRYTDGVGVMAFAEVAGTLLGAAAPVLTIAYTCAADSARSGTLTAPAASLPLSALFATSSSHWLPFPTATPPVTGVKAIGSYTVATTTTGGVALVLVKPLAAPMPILALNVASERDYLVQLPSLPRIYDGACLGYVVMVGGIMIAAASLCGCIEMGYG